MNEVIEKTEPEIARCSNCGAVLSGSFCFDCGQQDREVRRPFWRILRQLVHALLDLDGRVYRSMYYLYTRPGFLSSEYLSGRRANYTQPLRMFLVLSISFFLVVSIFGSINRLSSNPAEGPLAAINLELPGQQDAAPPLREILQEQRGDNGLADLDLDPQQIREALDGFDIPFLPEETEERLKDAALDQAISNFNQLRENPLEFPREVFSESLEYITIFILLMMPLLALLQNVFYIFKGRYYVEHFILTLHNHSFLIVSSFLLAFTGFIANVLPLLAGFIGWLDFIIVLWAAVYLFLSLKRFYRSSYLYSGLVYLIASLIYGALTTAGLAIFFLMAFLLY